ncbi:MAG: helix-turn-helix transcriptional regulator [Solirubrobacterales bacterium]|nr:helix-turn-helix transcriptional regulator [Solirubrobacterales bacterium]
MARRDPYYAEMADFRRRFAERFAPLRRARFPSQEAFSEHARLHRTTIGGLEQGKTDPRLSTLLILADSLDVSLADLVRDLPVPRERKPPPPPRRRRRS